MLFSKNTSACRQPRTAILTVVIDTEEEFDWAAPFDRESRGVANIAHQHLAQNIFRKFNIIPTYCIDYPVVENREAIEVLKEWSDKGECLIGTHLHPWVSPPYREEVNRVNSYAGNLSYNLEKDKLAYLTDAIEKAIGRRPVIFKAGRYGAGRNTARILSELGYQVDCSVVADTSFAHDHGPSYIGLPTQPYWFEGRENMMLELPNCRGYDGLLARWGSAVYPRIAGASGWRSLMAGVLVKSGLLERIPLTPEGIRAKDQIRMVRRMTAVGKNYFNYAYHSSSLMVGGAPYVRSEADLRLFLEDMDQFFDFFLNEFSGQHKTPLEMYDLLS